MALKPTIQNVAKLANVSTSTVSRVLNNHPAVLPETRQKILGIIQQLNYEPNRLARGLSSNDSFHSILIIYTHSSNQAIDNPYFSSIVNAIGIVAERNDYDLILHSGDDEEKEIEKALSMIHGKLIKGIVLLSSRTSSRFIQAVAQTGIPTVIVGQCDPSIKSESVLSVDTDSYKDSREIGNYLAEMGHTKIGCIHAPETYYVAVDRVQGFRDALKDHGIETPEGCLIDGGYTLESAYKAALELLCSQKITAIFATDDLKAMGIYKAAKNMNLRIPEDISVVGHNDFEYSALLNPPLTTVRVPIYELGVLSASKLFSMIHHHSVETSQMIPTELVIRNSVANLNRIV